MKNYFIANGEVLNTNMSIKEMESRVQATLDENTSGMAQFRIKEVSEKEIRMFFVRDFDYNPDKPIIYDSDMALITGVGIGAFQLQTVWWIPNDTSAKICREEFLHGYYKLYQVL